jgi:hypothetical protein
MLNVADHGRSRDDTHMTTRKTSALFGVVAAAALLVSMLQAATTGPANAAPRDRHCVTPSELARVKIGMARPKVRKIFGARGRLVDEAVFGDGDAWRTYSFRECGRSWSRSSVTIKFSLTERPAAAAPPAGMTDEELSSYYPVAYGGRWRVRSVSAR